MITEKIIKSEYNNHMLCVKGTNKKQENWLENNYQIINGFLMSYKLKSLNWVEYLDALDANDKLPENLRDKYCRENLFCKRLEEYLNKWYKISIGEKFEEIIL